MFDYKQYDGLGLAELIQKREVKPEEVQEMAIQEIEQKNGKLNAVIHRIYDQPKEEDLVQSKGIFAGVPVLTKDISQEIKGQPNSSGSKVLSNFIADQDSEFVRQLRDTGVVILGQTNVPEFALMGITEPVFYGASRNPWNTDYTPGGSSGGSAAAVASGMVPIAGANDGGGSIRIPAAFCGLFGLKPTRGRTPIGPTRGRVWQGASVDHILSRTVRDSAAMLDQYRYDRTSAFIAPPYNGSYLEASQTPISRPLKIAFTTNSPLGSTVDDECKEAVNKTVKLLESMGHHVIEQEASVDGKRLASNYMMLYFAEVAATLTALEDVIGRKVRFQDVEPTTWILSLLGKAVSAEEFLTSLTFWDQAAIQMENFHDDYDLYITPTTAYPPSRIGELDQTQFEKILIRTIGGLGLGGVLKKSGFVDKIAYKSLERTPFTQLANLTGQPAMTLPMHLTKDGLPCGVQVMARRGCEDLLLQLAGQLEITDSWINVKENPNY
ncbi:amidase [Lederbergia wuyishanensis]|uniref:Amidase n=1 Tax=Lederbergia wuyishanensis TaxID=1347903 RepID=A0ABU0D715_9BACI|nr:amidase family protein [Lederbergia wuyishanensis]MCJ8008819.1 amidase family protein [Lederbergia wuyishanensis]MDQ0344141.1 amidase [Lederbergia wuyishanensis]